MKGTICLDIKLILTLINMVNLQMYLVVVVLFTIFGIIIV